MADENGFVDPEDILATVRKEMRADAGERILEVAATKALTQLINVYMMGIASTNTMSGRAEVATRFIRGVKLWRKAILDVQELIANIQFEEE